MKIVKMKKFLPKKLWLLRAYVSFLIGFTELLLSLYVIISIINFFSRKTLLGDIVLGLGGLYLVAVSLSILLIAQIILLFIGIHDNIDDMRKKALDENFTVDLVAEKEKENSNIINSVFLIAVIVLSIVFSILSLTGESTPFAPNTNNSISQNSAIENNKSENDLSKSTEAKKEIDIADFLGTWNYELENGWFFNFEVQRDKILYYEYRMPGYEILLPRINKDMNWISLDFYRNENTLNMVNSQNCNNSVGHLEFINGDLNFVVGDGDPCGYINNATGLDVFKSGNVLKLEKVID